MAYKLKPCPFCSGDAEILPQELTPEDRSADIASGAKKPIKRWLVKCRICRACNIVYGPKPGCYAAWNNRRPDVEMLARTLKAELEKFRNRASGPAVGDYMVDADGASKCFDGKKPYDDAYKHAQACGDATVYRYVGWEQVCVVGSGDTGKKK